MTTPNPAGFGAAAQDALARMAEARQVLLKETQAVHDLMMVALTNAMRPGDVIAQGLPPHASINPVLFVTHAGVHRGRSYDAVAFEIVSAPTLVINPDHLNASGWRCDAIPISNKTGKPMSARAGGKFNVDPKSTVELRGVLAGGFEGVPCASQDPTDQLVAFATTFAHGRPDPAEVRASIEARREATRRANEAHILKLAAEDPEGFEGGIYLGDTGLLRGRGLGKP